MLIGFPDGGIFPFQMVKNLPAIQEPQVRSLGREDRLEKAMAAQSSIFVWRIPWTEKPGGPQSMGCRVRHDWVPNTDWLTFRALNITLCSLAPPKRVKSGQDNMWPILCLHLWYKQMITKGVKVQTLLLNWLWLRWKWENNPRKSHLAHFVKHIHTGFF